MTRPTQSHPDGHSRELLEVGWGLLRIDQRDGGQRIEVGWGLLSFTAKAPARLSATDGDEADDGETKRDLVRAAIERTNARMADFQAAAILGAVAVGLWFLSANSMKENWQALWGIGSVVCAAVSAGLGISVFGGGFRRRWLQSELSAAQAHREARRVAAGEHTVAIQELTASIAHEIRNPITAAKSLVQQMGEDPNATSNVEYATVALEELDRVEKSVSHLLRFARDEQIALGDLWLAEPLESAVESMRERAETAGVDLRLEVDSRGAVVGDGEKLRRVFLNLLGNAIDSMVEGQVRQPTLDVQVGENLGATEVWVRVRDNGPGIEPERLASIWAPFHTSKDTGTGLGLPICKKIVEAHAGSVEVDSTAGRGAEFVVTLPKRLD